jgi:hypothetical protein
MKVGTLDPSHHTGLPTMDTAELFDLFAQESMRIAEQTSEPRQREMFLRLALMWAAVAQQCHSEAPAMQATSASS